jgi:hypothetical protein
VLFVKKNIIFAAKNDMIVFNDKVGLQKGRQEVLQEIVVKLGQKGFSIEQITSLTSRTTEEIVQIFKEQGLA